MIQIRTRRRALIHGATEGLVVRLTFEFAGAAPIGSKGADFLYVASLRQVFRTTARSPVDLAATAAFAAVIFGAVELEEYLRGQKSAL
jgi:hypothetical protein